MKPFIFALLGISAALAYFSSEFTLHDVSLVYLISVSIGSVSLVVSKDPNRSHPVTALLSSVNRTVIYPVYQFITRTHHSMENWHTRNLLGLCIYGFIWYVFFKIIQIAIPIHYDAGLCGWLVFFGGCITTVYFCGRDTGCRPFYPIVKKKYTGRVTENSTTFALILILCGFGLYAGTLSNQVTPSSSQLGIIITYIAYLVVAGSFVTGYDKRDSAKIVLSIIPISLYFSSVICVLLAASDSIRIVYSFFSWLLKDFPLVHSSFLMIINAATRFPLSSYYIHLHSTIESHLSFLGITGQWWSVILMLDLGILLFLGAKLLSGGKIGVYPKTFIPGFLPLLALILTVCFMVMPFAGLIGSSLSSITTLGLQNNYVLQTSGNQISSLPGSDTISGSGTSGSNQIHMKESLHSGSIEQKIAAKTNDERSKYGIASMSYDGGLTSLARSRSVDMAGRNTVDHAGLPSDLGENCAMIPIFGNEDSIAEQAMSQWMSSPGHRENILRSEYAQFGIGVTIKNNIAFCVQDFRPFWEVK